MPLSAFPVPRSQAIHELSSLVCALVSRIDTRGRELLLISWEAGDRSTGDGSDSLLLQLGRELDRRVKIAGMNVRVATPIRVRASKTGSGFDPVQRIQWVAHPHIRDEGYLHDRVVFAFRTTNDNDTDLISAVIIFEPMSFEQLGMREMNPHEASDAWKPIQKLATSEGLAIANLRTASGS